jgi:hypothetical protein
VAEHQTINSINLFTISTQIERLSRDNRSSLREEKTTFSNRSEKPRMLSSAGDAQIEATAVQPALPQALFDFQREQDYEWFS